MIEEMESEGKNVGEAVESALRKMGLHRDQVEVQIVQEASAGILGFGARLAKVKITRKHWGTPSQTGDRPAPHGERPQRGSRDRDRGARPAPAHPRAEPRREARPEPRRQEPRREARPAPAHPRAEPRREARPEPRRQEPRRETSEVPAAHMREHGGPEGAPRGAAPPPADTAKACADAEAILKELLGLMLFTDAAVSSRWDPEQERVKTNVRTSETDRLIGVDGKTLESLQFLMTLMVSRRTGSPVAVQVDTTDYWQKKENEILSQALKGVEQVRNTGKPYRLQPMDAPMRRLIHKSLANHPDIMTSSEGDGSWRKIVLRPKS